ncbi:MAG: hypothetical protein ACYTG0_03545 [Planctomycetota bacterium]|jgi:hypothetical protein
MDPVELVGLILRWIERIVIDVAGVWALWLGCRYLKESRESTEAKKGARTADVKAGIGKFSFVGRGFAQGTVIALAGIVLLGISLSQPLTLTTSAEPPQKPGPEDSEDNGETDNGSTDTNDRDRDHEERPTRTVQHVERKLKYSTDALTTLDKVIAGFKSIDKFEDGLAEEKSAAGLNDVRKSFADTTAMFLRDQAALKRWELERLQDDEDRVDVKRKLLEAERKWLLITVTTLDATLGKWPAVATDPKDPSRLHWVFERWLRFESLGDVEKLLEAPVEKLTPLFSIDQVGEPLGMIRSESEGELAPLRKQLKGEDK